MYSDTNATRRNLVVISLAFIAYFIAGGSFTDTTVRLQVISAEFSKPIVLGIIAWAIFIWFLYRYQLFHKRKFRTEFNNEFKKWKNKPYFEKYLLERTNKPYGSGDDMGGYFPNIIRWENWHVVLRSTYRTNITLDENNNIKNKGIEANHQNPNPEFANIKLTDFKGWILALRATLACLYKEESFSSYMFPYLLAALAILGGVIRLVSN
jgi:hypothetical protein